MSDTPETGETLATIDTKAWTEAANTPDDAVTPDDEAPRPPEREEGEHQAEEPPVEGGDDDPPPEFWSAERKALWSRVTDPEVRAAIKGHVDDASKAISAKMEEAARARKEAEEAVRAEHQNRDQLTEWFHRAGPVLQKQFAGKWGNYTPQKWQELARDNPAVWAERQAEFQADVQAVREFDRQMQAETQAAQVRAQRAENTMRMAEHAKLAAALPAEFGPGKAQETYDKLSQFLVDSGIPAERISQIYEEPVVKIVLDAYNYRQLQAKAKEVTAPKPSATSASTTPRRVVPGAPNRGASPANETQRQAEERLRNGDGRLTSEERRWAFR